MELTNESYEKFDKRFPAPMTMSEIAAELDKMNSQEAEEYELVLCNELFNAFCTNFIKYNPSEFEAVASSEEYKLFKRHAQRLSRHTFYDAWCAFIEGKKNKVKTSIHEYIKTFENLSQDVPELAGSTYEQAESRVCSNTGWLRYCGR